MPKILEGEYKVDKSAWQRCTKCCSEALVRWAGYANTGVTWEPFDHAEPRSKLTKFLKSRRRATVRDGEARTASRDGCVGREPGLLAGFRGRVRSCRR